MALISANIQYNRGEHKLLDYSSLQSSYSVALAWAVNPYSNAAVGQFIYIQNSEEIDGKTYSAGPYVVDAIGDGAILTPLSKSVAGNSELSEIVSNNSKEISTIKTDIITTNTRVDNVIEIIGEKSAEGVEATGIYKEIELVKDSLSNIEVPVKDIIVAGESIVGADGIATIDLSDYATIDSVSNVYLTKESAVELYAAKDSVYTKEDINNKFTTLAPDSTVEAGKYVSNISIVDGKITLSKTDLPKYSISKSTDNPDYSAVYTLMCDGVADSVSINIPKDLVVSSGEVVELAENEVAGKEAGTYIKLVLNNKESLYIPAKDLVDTYKGSDYIIVNGYTISLNYDVLKNQLVTDLTLVFDEKYDAKNAASEALASAKTYAKDYADAREIVIRADFAAADKIIGDKIGSAKTTDESGVVTEATGLYKYIDDQIIVVKNDVKDGLDAAEDRLVDHDSRLDVIEGMILDGAGDGAGTLIKDIATIKTDVSALQTNTIQKIIINNIEVPVSNNTATITIDNATNEKAGFMSAEDKARLDSFKAIDDNDLKDLGIIE